MQKLTLSALFLLSLHQISAQHSGYPDSTFGTNGIAVQPWVDSGSMRNRFLEVNSNNEVIVGGYAYKNGGTKMVATRFTPNGQIDQSWGNSGTAYFNATGYQFSFGYCGKVLKDNSLLIGGDVYFSGEYSFAVAKLNSVGKPDVNFGNAGSAAFHAGPAGKDNVGNAMDVAPDGSVLVAGTCNPNGNNDFTVVRFTKNGMRDSTFGFNGVVIIPIGTGNDNCYSMAVQSDGKILLGGDIQDGSSYRFAVVRLKTNGEADSSFGTNGIQIYSLSSSEDDYGYCIRSLAGNSILFGGTARFNGQYHYTVLKMKENGSLDSSFGTDGIFHSNFGGGSSDYGQSFVVHPTSGNVLFTGRSFRAGSSLGVMCLKPNGTLDSSFHDSGMIYLQLGNAQHYSYGVALQNDGKVLASVDALTGFPGKVNVVRFQSHLPAFSLHSPGASTEEIALYPVPAAGKLFIRHPFQEFLKVNILSTGGKRLMCNERYDPATGIDLTNLSPGCYIVQILKPDGGVVNLQMMH